MSHRAEERIENLEREILRKLDHIEEELEELETPLPVASYPQTVAILVA